MDLSITPSNEDCVVFVRQDVFAQDSAPVSIIQKKHSLVRKVCRPQNHARRCIVSSPLLVQVSELSPLSAVRRHTLTTHPSLQLAQALTPVSRAVDTGFEDLCQIKISEEAASSS